MRWKQLPINEAGTYRYRFFAVVRDEAGYPTVRSKDRSMAADEVEAWCEEQWPAEPGESRSERWARRGHGFIFRHGVDATAFKMRWC